MDAAAAAAAPQAPSQAPTRSTRMGLSLFALYDQLRREIQALLAENEELTQMLNWLQDPQRVRHSQAGAPAASAAMSSAAPSSAPPMVSSARQSSRYFTFPSIVNPSELDLPSMEQSSVFGPPPWEPLSQESSGGTLGSGGSSDISGGVLASTGINRSAPLPSRGSNLVDQRLSWPLDRFAQWRLLRDADRLAVSQDSLRSSRPRDGQHPLWGQLVGEIAFQLDRRIISLVFPDRSSIYGYTVANIPQKIMAPTISGVPLQGDEHRCFLTIQRYVAVMNRLRMLGYNPVLHPTFAEAIVNHYGILPQTGPNTRSHQNPAFLRRVITETVPPEAQQDMLLLLDCLQELAREDGRPLLP